MISRDETELESTNINSDVLEKARRAHHIGGKEIFI